MDFDNILNLFSCFHVQKLVPIRAENSYHVLNFFLQTSINISDNSITIVQSCNVITIAIVIFGCNSHPYLYIQGTKIFQYCTCPAGRVTYNFHSSCKHVHLSFKSVCNKEHKGVICNMTSSSNSSKSTRPVGQVLLEELLVLSRFHS